MPNLGMFAAPQTLLASATVTTSGNSANLTIPFASSYRFSVEVTASSTNTTSFNVGVYSSSDGGTTYNLIAWTTQMSNILGGYQFVSRAYLGIGDAATVIGNYILGVNTAAANTQVVQNGPFDSRYIKIAWVLAGTSPSCAFSVKLTSVAQDLSD